MLRHRIWCALLVAALAVLPAIWLRGQAWFLPVLTPCLAGLLYTLRQQGSDRMTLAWKNGYWHLGEGTAAPMQLSGRALLLPWCAAFTLRCVPGGKRQHLLLFADSMAPEHWRRLRVRLRLEGAD